MGMYTELVCAFELKENVPQSVVDILQFMVNKQKNETVSPLPNHELFKTDHWQWMLTSDSYYFPGDTHSTIRFDTIANCHYVTIRCNVKNYDNEIEKFIDWVQPYIAYSDDNGEFIGYSRYEEARNPTLIYIGMRE